MKLKWIAPQDYADFACIADKCHHSCCVGWEIDVDAQTLKRYRKMDGEWRARFEDHLQQAQDGTASFRLTSDERCPFLKEDGLCELILTFGEDMLCQICADHPRFRNFYANRTEIGLGLCCEEAARLILTRADPMRLVVIDDDGIDDEPDPDEQRFLLWRDQCIERMQDRSIPILERVRQLVPLDIHISEWKDFLLDLERLEETWADRIREAKECTIDENWEIPLEQLMVYLLYRHLPQGFAEDDLKGRVAFTAFLWHLIYQLFASSEKRMEDLIEIARQCSSELEYSEENTDAIINEIVKRRENGCELS